MSESPDILCLNETRISVDYLKENKVNENFFSDYYTFWNNSISRKGYSGVSILTKIKPINYAYGIKTKKHDNEGRVVTLEFEQFYLVAVYVPNSGEGLKRLDYRVKEWDKKFFNYLNKLKERKNVIVTGDLNVAHTEMDIYDPNGKSNQPGFTPDERQSFQNLLDSGFIDTYRHLYPNKQEFTFWAHRANSRVGNKGWRLDYFLINSGKENMLKNITNSEILADYTGSDHCPIKLTLN